MKNAEYLRIKLLFSLLIFLFICTDTFCLPQVIKLGAIFEENDDYDEVFLDAISKVNKNRTLLPRSLLSAEIMKIYPGDSIQAMRASCNLLDKGVVAIFGPESPSTSNLVQSVARKYDIPYIQIAWNSIRQTNSYGVNLYPHPSSLAKAYKDLTEVWRSGKFTVVYRDTEALTRISELLQYFKKKNKYFTIRQHFSGELYEKLLKDISKNGETNILIDLPLIELHQFLQVADKFNLMTEYNNYLITSLDAHIENFSEFWNGLTNISSFRMINNDHTNTDVWNINRWKPMKLKHALLYDGISLVAKALHDLDAQNSIEPGKFSCEKETKWIRGNVTVNYMKSIHFPGLTGIINFDDQGRRINFNLDAIQFKGKETYKIGNWSYKKGINLKVDPIVQKEEIEGTLKGRTLLVTAIIASPYIEEKQEAGLKGNERYQGYCVDLLNYISQMKGFKFEISIVSDGSRGTRNEDGEWDGMIRELLYRRADLAIGDLTINTQREEDVDFTMPFMNLGIGILFKKPARKEPTLFSFMFPFSTPVWIYMATAYLGMTVVVYILARLSPYEWTNPHPCEMYPDILCNQFNFLNTLWFSIGSVMQQGSELAPRALSTRLAAGFWWFFTLIIVSTYTANLAAFLTSARLQSPIKNVQDLAKQTGIPYGCLEKGSTRTFFKKSDHEIYRKMSRFMEESGSSVFANSSEMGVARVMKGNYAFIMETMSILYETERKCELTQIGDKLVDINYGIAMPPGSPYVPVFSECILALQENGTLAEIKDKWWKTKNKCPEEKTSITNTKLTITNLGGVFVVLGIGMGFGVVVVIVEFLWKTKSIPYEERRCICIEFFLRIKDILICSGSTRVIDRTSLYAMDDSVTRSSLFGTTSAKTTASIS